MNLYLKEKEIAIKTEEINKDFSEALEILKELFKNGVKPSEESIKNAINEVLIGFNFIKESELKEKLVALLKELQINANIDEELLKENLLNIILENKESLKGDKGENGKSAYELWLENEENAGKSKDEFLESLKGKAPTKEEIKPIVEETLKDLNLSIGGIIGEDKKPISDEKLKEIITEVATPLLNENFHQVGNTINNALSLISNALEQNALLCNITNTPPPAQIGTNNGYKKGFIWIDNSKTPNDIYVSDFTSWIKVKLSEEPQINKLRITIQSALRDGWICLSKIRLIKKIKPLFMLKALK